MEIKTCLYKETVDSGLGLFELRLRATGKLLSVEPVGSAIVIQSTGHLVTIKRVAASTDWLADGLRVDYAMAWLFYITKHSKVEEQLSIEFRLLNRSPGLQADADSGQWLTAIEFEDGVRQVHLGTQDEEYFSRYGEAAWLPSRLVSQLADNKLVVTTIEAEGLVTGVPELFLPEQFYLHYILAEGPRRKSVDYPDEWEIPTRHAVEQSQEVLEAAWCKQAN